MTDQFWQTLRYILIGIGMFLAGRGLIPAEHVATLVGVLAGLETRFDCGHDARPVRAREIDGFEDFCRAKQLHVHRRIALDTEKHVEIFQEPNLNADMAIFVISKNSSTLP